MRAAAAASGVSVRTAYKWQARYRREGHAGGVALALLRRDPGEDTVEMRVLDDYPGTSCA
jgi:hypothetical protein